MDSAHTSKWAIGEVVLGGPFLIGIAMHFIVPWSLPPGGLQQAASVIGLALSIIGLGLIVSTRREFAAQRQPTDPGQPTSRIVTTGVFAISRNPLYLGGVSVLLGLALMLNRLWAIAMLPVSIVLCHYILIVPEERYLAAKFSAEYRAYRASVQRWLGRR